MRKFKMTTDSKKHLKSLVKDLREKGFNIVTYTDTFVELENESEFVTIEVI